MRARVSVLGVVQARMGSSRLPGKVIMDLAGVPMLQFMLERVQRAELDELVVATSEDAKDDAVAVIAMRMDLPVVRGSEDDVLSRFVLALDTHGADHVVRLTGDCPLADPAVIRAAVDQHIATEADYTSNTLVRTFPDGLDVEVVRASALREAHALATDQVEREHVTPYVYRRPERFALRTIRCPENLGDERWTVDTFDDLARVRGIVAALGSRDFSWRDVLRVAPAGSTEALSLVPTDDATPARRSWIVSRAGRAIGHMTVTVQTGVGTLEIDVPEGEIEAALELLDIALAADRQVTELTLQPPPT